MIREYTVNQRVYEEQKSIHEVAYRFSEKEPDEIKRITRNLAYFKENDVFNGDKLYQEWNNDVI